MSMHFTKTGIVRTRTDTIYGMLEQGGVANRKTLMRWESVEKLTGMTRDQIRQDWDKPGSWNDWMTIAQFVCAAWGEDRVIRTGHTIH